MSDTTTTVAELQQLVDRFVSERDWSQFHTPKNLSMALAIEAGELMEHFQWITPEASRALAHQPEKLQPVAEELADVFAYCLAVASELDIDLATAVREKMKKNELKYPAGVYRGRYSIDDQTTMDG